MSDAEVATEDIVKAKSRGRPKKDKVAADKSENSTNNTGVAAKGRTSQRKAATIASNALKEQAIGAAKQDNFDDEPKPKKGRGRPKSSAKRKPEKKKEGRGRPKKIAKELKSESNKIESNTEEGSPGD